MQLKNIMTEEVGVIAPKTSICEAAKRMRSLDVGALPVCDGNRLVGMLTDRDLAIRAVAEGRDPNSTTAEDTMSPAIIYCFDDQDTAEAERVMRERQVRRLPVVNRDKRLVGIVSLGDLATKDDVSAAGETLEKVSQPSE
jgi:CBS domain-containing protein